MKKVVDELTILAPEDHYVLIHIFDFIVTEVRDIETSTLFFSDFNKQGQDTSVAFHFSQLVAHIVDTPKKSEERVITGFPTVKESK